MEYKINLKELLIFESISLLGRLFLNKKPKLNNNKNYLNFGCGENILDEYINADFFCLRCIFQKNKINKWELDFRYPLKCDDEVFDGIYSEHTIEHLYPTQVKKLLTELHRILKKDAKIRITVPDLQKYIDFYNGEYDQIDIEEFRNRYNTGCSAIRNTTQNYFHVSAWDFEELKIYMEEAGFKNIEKKSLNDSSDKKLNIDIKNRNWETLYIEAIK